MLIQPVFDRLIVKKDTAADKTSGGIIIPDQAKEPVTKGTIIAVGPGKYAEKSGVFIPTTLKPGQKVLFHPCAGTELQIGDESFYNMPEIDIWAVIVQDDNAEE